MLAALEIVSSPFRFGKPQKRFESAGRGRISLVSGFEPQDLARKLRAVGMRGPPDRLCFGLLDEQVGGRRVRRGQALGGLLAQGAELRFPDDARRAIDRRD